MRENLFHVILNSNDAGTRRVRSLWARPAPDITVEVEHSGRWIRCRVLRLIGGRLWVRAAGEATVYAGPSAPA